MDSLEAYAGLALVTAVSLLGFLALSFLVGQARLRHGVKPPSCEGPPAFLQVLRAQQNTIEFLLAFLPLLWLFGIFVGPTIALVLGSAGLSARVLFVVGYLQTDPSKRIPGFVLGLLVTITMGLWLVGSLLLKLI